jgi:exopolysaccharide production protein ExoZ
LTRKLEFLQVLRAVAALLVVVCHGIYYVSIKNSVPDIWQTLSRSFGIFGVSLFFVISGFIMVHTSGRLFGTKAGPATFAYRRILRIVPMYWLATLIEIALTSRHSGLPPMREIFSSLFFLPYVGDAGFPLRPIVGVGWTLNHEMFFYALFAVALLFGRKLGLSLLIVSLSGIVALGSFSKPLVDTNEPLTVLTFVANPIILLFAAGVILGVISKRLDIGRLELPYAGLLSSGLIVLNIVLFLTVLKPAPLLSDVNLPPWPLGWEIVFWVVCIAIVAFGIVAPDGRRYLAFRGFVALGDASYSIYLFHYTIIAAFGKLWSHVFQSENSLEFIAFSCVAASLGGLLIHHGIEKPILKRIVKPKEAAAVSGTVNETTRPAPVVLD